jgi:hypothetical protein
MEIKGVERFDNGETGLFYAAFCRLAFTIKQFPFNQTQ